MGLSNFPSPSEGIVCVILVNTAISVSLLKGMLRSILHIVGISLASLSTDTDEIQETLAASYGFSISPTAFMEKLKSQIPTIKFGSVFKSPLPDQDCSVCLTEFEPESEINYLSCGHVYHENCLKKWLDYWNFTCPLCRTPLLTEEESTWVG